MSDKDNKIKKIFSFLFFNKNIQLLLKLTIFSYSIFYLFKKINYKDFISILDHTQINFYYFFLIFILQTIGAILVLFRWHYLLELASGYTHRIKDLLSPVIYSNILYGFSFLGFFFTRVIFLSKKNVRLNQVFSSVIVEKGLSFISIMIIFILSFIVFKFFFNFSEIPYINHLFLISIISLFFFFFFLFLIYKYENQFIVFLKKIIILKYFIHYLNFKKLIKPFLFTFFLQLFSFFILLSIPLFLGIEISIISFAILLPIVTFFSALPISITHWGFRESVFIFFYGLIGFDPNVIFFISFSYGLVGILIFIFHVLIYEFFNFFIKK